MTIRELKDWDNFSDNDIVIVPGCEMENIYLDVCLESIEVDGPRKETSVRYICKFRTILTPLFRFKLTPLFRSKLTPLKCIFSF